jgi:dihydropteroate synthase
MDAQTQMSRVLPVIEAVRQAIDQQGRGGEVIISIDTTLAEVARSALESGASMINDVSAGCDDPAMFGLAGESGAGIVLMHMQGRPATMQDKPTYDDVVQQVRSFLLDRASQAQAAGVDRRQIVIDPGIGFGKTMGHNAALLAHLDELVATGYPVLVGASRKRFIGQVSPQTGVDAADRLGGTCAVTAIAAAAGVAIVRVHDVAANRQAADVAQAIAGRGIEGKK